jgi:hypothetical protein
LINDADWLGVLDGMITLRRGLKADYSIPVRHEIKARNFRNGRGVFKGLRIGQRGRFQILRRILDEASRLPLSIFAVAVDKIQCAGLHNPKGSLGSA